MLQALQDIICLILSKSSGLVELYTVLQSLHFTFSTAIPECASALSVFLLACMDFWPSWHFVLVVVDGDP